jgi:hypothetical protein
MSLDPSDVRRAITERLEALPVEGKSYVSTADNIVEAWRESREPLIPEREPSALAHLVFFVDDRDTVIGGPGSSVGRPSGSTPFGGVQTESPIVVRFLAKMRAKDRIGSWDAAGDAGLDAVRWLIQEDGASWPPGFILLPTARLMSRAPVGPQEWLRVDLRLAVLYPLSLTIGSSGYR